MKNNIKKYSPPPPTFKMHPDIVNSIVMYIKYDIKHDHQAGLMLKKAVSHPSQSIFVSQPNLNQKTTKLPWPFNVW